MKLIIDIPKDLYDMTRTPNNVNYIMRMAGFICSAIAEGTPLDDVKAEIEKHQFSREYCCDHNIDTAIDMSMVRIVLDNIESEFSQG